MVVRKRNHNKKTIFSLQSNAEWEWRAASKVEMQYCINPCNAQMDAGEGPLKDGALAWFEDHMKKNCRGNSACEVDPCEEFCKQ